MKADSNVFEVVSKLTDGRYLSHMEQKGKMGKCIFQDLCIDRDSYSVLCRLLAASS